MFTTFDADLIGLCIEWFLYGIYSGIFAIYLQCPKKESRSAKIVFYVLCLLYVLSTATVVGDLLDVILAIYADDALSFQLQFNMLSKFFHLQFVQLTVAGCCDVIAQFILIYRCWIMWGKNIRVVIIPLFLTITFIVFWIVQEIPTQLLSGPGTVEIETADWGVISILTALTATMVVNTLVTGLIVFKILKVFLEVKPTSVELTLGLLGSAAGEANLQHIIFIIIESGMVLFAVQLARIVLASIFAANASPSIGVVLATNYVIYFHEMLNGIAPTLILVRVSMGLSFDDVESFKEGVGSLNFYNPPSASDPNTTTTALGSSGSMALQERNEDLCFDSSPRDDPNSLRRVGSCSGNIPAQERIEVII